MLELGLHLGATSSAVAALSSSPSHSSSLFAVRINSILFSNGGVRSRVSFSTRLMRAASLRCFASSSGFDGVQVQNPVVEMDGDEMTRIIWRMTKEKGYRIVMPLMTRSLWKVLKPLLNKLLDFVQKLEAACIERVEAGKMTKDLAISVHGPKVSREFYLNTEEFIDAVAQNLESKLREPALCKYSVYL